MAMSNRAATFDAAAPYSFEMMTDSDGNKETEEESKKEKIMLSIADNVLNEEMCLKKLKQIEKEIQPVDTDTFQLDYPKNFQPLVDEAVNFLDKRVIKNSNKNYKLNSENMHIGLGLSQLLSCLLWCTCDENDTVLMLEPRFYFFKYEFQSIAHVNIKAVPTTPFPNYEININYLQEKYEQCIKNGEKVSCFLLVSPNNPCGKVYDRKSLKMLLEWCIDKKIHVIADEIYALSILDEEKEFVSTIDIMQNDLPKSVLNENGWCDYIHWVYSVSKDFSLTNMRGSFLYTENKAITDAMMNIWLYWHPPNLTQQYLYHFIKDKSFLDEFIKKSNEMLKQRWLLCCNVINNKKYDPYYIPCINLESGFFLWVDLRSIIDILAKYQNIKIDSNDETVLYEQNDYDGQWRIEKQFTKMIIMTEKVDLIPGKLFGCQQAGFYRIVFSCTTENNIIEALNRLSTLYFDIHTHYNNYIKNGKNDKNGKCDFLEKLINRVPLPQYGHDSDKKIEFLHQKGLPKSCKIAIGATAAAIVGLPWILCKMTNSDGGDSTAATYGRIGLSLGVVGAIYGVYPKYVSQLPIEVLSGGIRFGLAQIVYQWSIKIAEMAIGGKKYFDKNNIVSPWQAILTSIVPSQITFADTQTGIACNNSRERALKSIVQMLIDIGMTGAIAYIYKNLIEMKFENENLFNLNDSWILYYIKLFLAQTQIGFMIPIQGNLLAILTALIFGNKVKVSVPYDWPITAVSMRDFWKKWSIHVGFALRDLIYIPMGGKNSNYFKSVSMVFLANSISHSMLQKLISNEYQWKGYLISFSTYTVGTIATMYGDKYFEKQENKQIPTSWKIARFAIMHATMVTNTGLGFKYIWKRKI